MKKCVFHKFIVLCFLICEGVMALLQIDISPPVKTTVGNNTVEIKCSITRDDEFITSFTITAFNRNTTTYEVIASFFSVQKPQPVFTKYGKYLEGRASLIANTTYEASILFHEVRCEDNNTYACVVNFIKDNVADKKESIKTTLTVGSYSMKPDSLMSDSNLRETENGQNVTLTCRGNVGNPPGTFVWKKYQHNTPAPVKISNVSTTTTFVSDNCSFYGTSHLTVQLKDQDNRAVFACVEESHLSTANMEIQTQSLNVYYPVKGARIGRNPLKQDYIQGVDKKIKLNCTADGNPMPRDFLLYKEENVINNVTTDNTLTINNLSVNDNGVYICVAFNSFRGETYNSTAKMVLAVLVIEGTTTTPTDTSSDASKQTSFIIGLSVGIIVLLVTIAVIICFRRFKCKNKITEKIKVYDTLNLPADNSRNTEYTAISRIYSNQKSVQCVNVDEPYEITSIADIRRNHNHRVPDQTDIELHTTANQLYETDAYSYEVMDNPKKGICPK